MTAPAGPRGTAAGQAAGPRGRRSWPLALAGALVVAGCALSFAETLARAGDRAPVLAAARAVPAGQPLAAADLQVVRVSAGASARLVPAAAEPGVLGRPAAAPLQAGELLAAPDIGPSAPPPGQDDMGAAVRAGQYPPDLSAGQAVDVLATPSAGGGAAPALPVGQAVVLGVAVSAGTGSTVIELRLAESMVPQVAAAAATGQLAVVTVPAGGG